jgi:hypothetical protein
VYVWLVALVMSPHAVPSVAHRCHWYAYDDGLFDHVPLEAVRVDPAFAVPLIVGDAVFCGDAARAAVARTKPTTATASEGSNSRQRRRLCVLVMLIPLLVLRPKGKCPVRPVRERESASSNGPLTPEKLPKDVEKSL